MKKVERFFLRFAGKWKLFEPHKQHDMSRIKLEMFSAFFGATAGNYLAQFFGDKVYMTAFERSFFQGISILMVGYFISRSDKLK